MSMKPSRPGDNIEQIKQWGIKSISSRVIDEIADAAHDLRITNGQLVEKMWEHWKNDGQNPQPSQPPPINVLDDLVAILTAIGGLPEHVPLPKEVRTLINAYARLARGMTSGMQLVPGPASQPLIAGQPQKQITVENGHGEG